MAHSNSGLLKLPRELREIVWKYAMADQPKVFLLEPEMRPTPFFLPKSLPAIAFVRRSLFDEIFVVWIRARDFEFDFNITIPEWFAYWMDHVDEGRTWANIKSMSFTAALRVYEPSPFSYPFLWNAADFVQRAITFQHLTITISSLTIIHFDSQSGLFTHIKPIGELLTTLDLRNILLCKQLQSLTILCCPTWTENGCIEADDLGCRPQDLFGPLLDWFWAGFKEMGMTVEIQGKLQRRGKKFSSEPRWNWGT
ncbi:hypothetical protein BDU57DRAFT_515654 [Ampelomyces quisqualis]|uniref:Uncharacterized protein n=1 Tax=Ampelomyces quisqualis TaxID=50730 RepID=A0A6A5QKC6_AMPQU|nr:hypothetical protein BDU57DRAFT_515654 [Ampelomyces quisqualis]